MLAYGAFFLTNKIVLLRCNQADDFEPAKILMNMCFTFFLEVNKGVLVYLFALYRTYLVYVTIMARFVDI